MYWQVIGETSEDESWWGSQRKFRCDFAENSKMDAKQGDGRSLEQSWSIGLQASEKPLLLGWYTEA